MRDEEFRGLVLKSTLDDSSAIVFLLAYPRICNNEEASNKILDYQFI
jgi:hypothetical protein